MKYYALTAALLTILLTGVAVHAQETIPPQQIITTTSAAPPVAVIRTGKPYCREFTQTLTIAGRTQSGYGTACLQPDGSWELHPAEKHVTVETPAGETVTTVEPIRYVTRGAHVFVVSPQPYVVFAQPPVVVEQPVIVEQPPVVEVIGGHHHWH